MKTGTFLSIFLTCSPLHELCIVPIVCVATLGEDSLSRLAERRVSGVLDHNSILLNVLLPCCYYNVY